MPSPTTSGSAIPIEVRAQGVCFSEGQLLCARHRKSDADYWVLPGGHVDPGESLWDALVREFDEETGLIVESGSLWSVSEFQSADRHVIDCVFRVDAFSGRPRIGEEPERGSESSTLVELGWFDRETFAGLAFRPSILERQLRAQWDNPTVSATYLGVESV